MDGWVPRAAEGNGTVFIGTVGTPAKVPAAVLLFPPALEPVSFRGGGAASVMGRPLFPLLLSFLSLLSSTRPDAAPRHAPRQAFPLLEVETQGTCLRRANIGRLGRSTEARVAELGKARRGGRGRPGAARRARARGLGGGAGVKPWAPPLPQ